MKSVIKMIKANRNIRQGNHGLEIKGHIRNYYYFWTAIVVVNTLNRTFYTDNGGYNTPSTSRVINAYKRNLTDFTEVSKQDFIE
jgi:hypothetical protein